MTRLFILLLSVCLCNTAYSKELLYENPFVIPKPTPYNERNYKDTQYVPQEVLIVVDNSLKSATSTFFLVNDKPIAEIMVGLFGDMNERERALCKHLQEVKDEMRKHWTFKVEYYLSNEAYITLPEYPMYRVGFNKWEKFTDNVSTDPGMTLEWFKYLHDVFYADSIEEELHNRFVTDFNMYYDVWSTISWRFELHKQSTSLDCFDLMRIKFGEERTGSYTKVNGIGMLEKVEYKYKYLDYRYEMQRGEFNILLNELKAKFDGVYKVTEEDEKYQYKEPKW